ncbi:MAG: hypothetical protein LIP12_09500 [Clostridiales bacterium]|nr:hypothetical protein [Clostridiales bacterium]
MKVVPPQANELKLLADYFNLDTDWFYQKHKTQRKAEYSVEPDVTVYIETLRQELPEPLSGSTASRNPIR